MSELIDLVDSSGAVIKRAVERDDAAIYDGLYMRIIVAVIRNQLGEVLVHKRAKTKIVNPGYIDHVCGAMLSGESPKQAALRESEEEVGLRPDSLAIIRQGLNPYGRYCYLLAGTSALQPPEQLNTDEVEWAAYYSPKTLYEKAQSGEFKFVDGFFEDLEQSRLTAK